MTWVVVIFHDGHHPYPSAELVYMVKRAGGFVLACSSSGMLMIRFSRLELLRQMVCVLVKKWKAFDSVPYKGLLEKLKTYGING